jgi:hypothetical protein
MANVTKMTDEQLKSRIQKMTRRGKIAKWAFMLCAVAGCLGLFVLPALFALNTLALGVSLIVAVHSGGSKSCCAAELTDRARERAKTVRVPEPLKQSTPPPASRTNVFNPVAATILAADMTPMAPLRLKKRVANYVMVSNG